MPENGARLCSQSSAAGLEFPSEEGEYIVQENRFRRWAAHTQVSEYDTATCLLDASYATGDFLHNHAGWQNNFFRSISPLRMAWIDHREIVFLPLRSGESAHRPIRKLDLIGCFSTSPFFLIVRAYLPLR